VTELDPADPRAALLYAEGVRALDDQQSVVESIRVRAGILLSAASVATSFLAGVAVGRKGLSFWGWLATTCFVGVGVLSFMILWPKREWTFRANIKKLVRDYVDGDAPASLAEMHRDLALHMENWAEANSWKMRWLFIYFQVAVLLLGFEVVLWIIDLWGR
jgi:hypothetical protein